VPPERMLDHASDGGVLFHHENHWTGHDSDRLHGFQKCALGADV
jgi:hypothetical protein